MRRSSTVVAMRCSDEDLVIMLLLSEEQHGAGLWILLVTSTITLI